MRSLLIILVAPFFFTVPAEDAAAQRTLTCKSRHHDYKYCRADTNNRVRLDRQLSRARCVEGRSWGYDRHGIWVDDGCEGRFEYGRGTSRHDDDDDNVGAAVAVGALALVLGAAAVAADNDDHHKHHSHHNDSSRRDNHRTSRPPSWMIGTFRGYINYGDTEVTLIVHSDGTIDRYVEGRRTKAHYRNGRVYVQDRVADVDRTARGFRLNTNDYRRVR